MSILPNRLRLSSIKKRRRILPCNNHGGPQVGWRGLTKIHLIFTAIPTALVVNSAKLVLSVRTPMRWQPCCIISRSQYSNQIRQANRLSGNGCQMRMEWKKNGYHPKVDKHPVLSKKVSCLGSTLEQSGTYEEQGLVVCLLMLLVKRCRY